jgi:hypothetical protein
VVSPRGPTIFIADAHRGDGKRFVVHADEKLTAFVKLEFGGLGLRPFVLDKLARFAFWIATGRSRAAFHLVKRIEDCNARCRLDSGAAFHFDL